MQTAFAILSESVKDADFVQESVSERLELKHETYRVIQESAGSGISISGTIRGIFSFFIKPIA